MQDDPKKEVIEKLIRLIGYGVNITTILDICYEAGADYGAEDAAGCGRVDLRANFQKRIDIIMQSRRLHDIDPKGCTV